MRPITVTVGPLAAGVGNAIFSGQTATRAGLQQLTLTGTLVTMGWAGAFTITGSLLTVTSTTSGAMAPGMLVNATGVPFNCRIIGPGPNPGTWIVYPGVSAPTLTAAFGRANPVATLDAPRQVSISNSEPAGSVSFTVYGTDGAGNPISETLVSTGALITTSQNFLTVTQFTVSGPTTGPIGAGTTPATATSAWVAFDPYVDVASITKQATVTGVVNFTVQVSNDDPNSQTNPVAPGAMTWSPDPDATFVGASTNLEGSWTFVPLWARVLLNSGAGSVRATFVQQGGAF